MSTPTSDQLHLTRQQETAACTCPDGKSLHEHPCPVAKHRDAIEALEECEEQLRRCNEVADRRGSNEVDLARKNELLKIENARLREALHAEWTRHRERNGPLPAHTVCLECGGKSGNQQGVHEEDCLLAGYEPEDGEES